MNVKQINNRGITLITLVITIIIIVILASVTINLSVSDNGLFSKAKKAKNDYEIAVNEEEQKIANLDLTNYAEGTVIEKWVPEIVSATDIANKTDKSNYYGKTVTNYKCINNAGVKEWKIFYADNNNIYLIADDYIHKDYCPNSQNNEIIKKGTDYLLSMDDVIKDYSGSDSITDTKLQNLNKQYFEYLTSETKTSTDDNAKIMAYMLDTNVWGVYAGDKAEYAIGGPTIEMFLNSYNQTHTEVNYKSKVEINTDGSTIGYCISKDGGTNYNYIYDGMIDTKDEKYGQLYIITSKDKSGYMYMASPSSKANDQVYFMSNYGRVTTGNAHGEAGFRPVVCLNKTVQLESQENGTYIIK